MALELDAISVVIPITSINKYYPGGFNALVKKRGGRWDNHLYITSAMNNIDIQLIISEWEKRGLKSITQKGDEVYWKDLCVVDYFNGIKGNCKWLNVDLKNRKVEYAGKISFRGTAVIFKEGEVLLVKDTKKSLFSLPGGKVKKREPSLAAAVRETFEELNISSYKAERLFKCDYVGRKQYHKVSMIYSNDEPKLKSNEISEFVWWDGYEPINRFNHVDRIIENLEYYGVKFI